MKVPEQAIARRIEAAIIGLNLGITHIENCQKTPGAELAALGGLSNSTPPSLTPAQGMAVTRIIDALHASSCALLDTQP